MDTYCLEQFQWALRKLLNSLVLDRAVILYNFGKGLQPMAAHEIPIENFHELAPISLNLLDSVSREGKPYLSNSSKSEGGQESISQLLFSARSVICVPLVHDGEVVGLIYSDLELINGAFEDNDLGKVKRLAADLVERLTGQRPDPAKPPKREPTPPKEKPDKVVKTVPLTAVEAGQEASPTVEKGHRLPGFLALGILCVYLILWAFMH